MADNADVKNDLFIQTENLKRALYIDTDDDDDLIRSYIKAAMAYVQKAVDDDADLTKYQQYDFAVQMLAQFWYQNRGIDMKQTPYQVVSMIQQLRGLIG